MDKLVLFPRSILQYRIKISYVMHPRCSLNKQSSEWSIRVSVTDWQQDSWLLVHWVVLDNWSLFRPFLKSYSVTFCMSHSNEFLFEDLSMEYEKPNSLHSRFWSLRSGFKSQLVSFLKLKLKIIQVCGALASNVTLQWGRPL